MHCLINRLTSVFQSFVVGLEGRERGEIFMAASKLQVTWNHPAGPKTSFAPLSKTRIETETDKEWRPEAESFKFSIWQSMQQTKNTLSISTIWRRKKFIVEINPDATVKEFGCELLELTEVKAETMRLIVPQPSTRGSQLLYPFSDQHMHLSLQETYILQGKSIRMMGVSKDEVDKVLRNEKVDMRIAGFEEEDKRLRRRMFGRPYLSLKLPQGNYIFCDCRPLSSQE